MSVEARIASGARAVCTLGPAVDRLLVAEAERADVARAAERGWFTPEEDDRLRGWFARYLTARAGLLETIEELRPSAAGRAAVDEPTRVRTFVVVFAAACLLVRAGRFLVRELAAADLVQRKLNEAAPLHRIPRKQLTAVRRQLTRPVNAWRLQEASSFAERHRPEIDALAGDELLGPVVARLRRDEDALRMSVGEYVKARLRYRWHSYRRRRASAAGQGLFLVAEAFGRVIAEACNPWHADRVRAAHRDAVASLLEPGDVIVARHDHALSNLFLPGYWPHAALHVGPRDAADPRSVLEARKDGVLLRPLHDTLAVDAFVVLRPRLPADAVARAITNALQHEGKEYNFDFDFFTDDRLVCTEVVYRAYEGVGDISFPLRRRSGRPTLSAEDLLDMAVVHGRFEPVAVFGTPKVGDRLVTGPAAAKATAESYTPGSG
jgi:hypothetical protein